jgi:hypothetical protein
MPDIRIYVKDAIWNNIMKSCGHDPQKAKKKIVELVEHEYGPR